MRRYSARFPWDELRTAFGSRLQENVVMANYTSSRIGGPADGLLVVQSASELENAVTTLWQLEVPFHLIGSGSNILISDEGVRGIVIINRARNIRIEARNTPPTVWAESGANLGAVARQVALRGFGGLEWAATVPGTIGGAVYGNAGAHGADMRSNLVLAEILHRNLGKTTWNVEDLAYDYRSSALKRNPGDAIVLAARLRLFPSTTDEVQKKMEEYAARRRSTQPPGASMGSMFKNPPGDAAGRLIDAAGLKGTRRGGAEISKLHANFFVNCGQAKAIDVYELIQIARQTVLQRFGVSLELEIELLGSFPNDSTGSLTTLQARDEP